MFLVARTQETSSIWQFDHEGSDLRGIILVKETRHNGLEHVNNPPAPGTKAVSTIYIGKWSVSILSSLREKPRRHGELRRHLGVSQRMLTRTLRDLESTGLIARCVTKSSPLAVEYSLTKVGRSFLVPLRSICHWAERQNKGVNGVLHLVKMDPKAALEMTDGT